MEEVENGFLEDIRKAKGKGEGARVSGSATPGMGTTTSTPNTRTLTVSQDDSFIIITSCSVNQVLTQQIPTGTNRSFSTHNTNRQVAAGAISANTGHSVGSVSLRATSTYGNVSIDRVEILGINEDSNDSEDSGGNEDFFSVLGL